MSEKEAAQSDAAQADAAQSDAERHARQMWCRDTASQSLGMEITSIKPGEAIVTMTIRDDMMNGHGSCHGSFIFALADSAFAFACNSYGPIAVAADCQISFLRPVPPKEQLTAYATETYRRGRNGVYDIKVKAGDGETVAVFRGKSRVVSDGNSKNEGPAT